MADLETLKKKATAGELALIEEVENLVRTGLVSRYEKKVIAAINGSFAREFDYITHPQKISLFRESKEVSKIYEWLKSLRTEIEKALTES